MTEESKVRECDEKELAKTFSEQRARLWQMINFRMDSRLSGRIDPDDVLQDAYLAACQRLKHFPTSNMTMFVWVRSIVYQTIIDLHRHHIGAQARNAKKEVGIYRKAKHQASSISMALHLTAHLTSPSQAAIRAETFDKIEDIIAQMDPIDQEVLALRHFEELTNSEVAEVLGIQQKAASIRYIRALKRLKDIVLQVPGLKESSIGKLAK